MEVLAVLCNGGAAAYWKSLQIPVISPCTSGNPCATPIVTRGEGSFSYQGVSTRGVRHSPETRFENRGLLEKVFSRKLHFLALLESLENLENLELEILEILVPESRKSFLQESFGLIFPSQLYPLLWPPGLFKGWEMGDLRFGGLLRFRVLFVLGSSSKAQKSIWYI